MARPRPRTSRRWPRSRVTLYAVASAVAPLVVAALMSSLAQRVQPPRDLPARAHDAVPPPVAGTPRIEASAPPRAPSAASSASAAPIEVVPEASAAVTAIDGLDAVAWRKVLRASAVASDWKKGAAAIHALLKLEPAALSEQQITDAAADVTAAIEVVDAPGASTLFDALGAAPSGLDVLYALVNKRAGTKSAQRAEDLLRKPEVRALASPALSVTLDLRAGTCAEKEVLSERAGTVGDHRTLAVLVPLCNPDCEAQVTGCCLVYSVKAQAAVQALMKKIQPARAVQPKSGKGEFDPYQ